MKKDPRSELARSIEPYVPGEQPEAPGWIKLNTNENAYPPSGKVKEALIEAASDELILKRYPHAYGEPLRGDLAKAFSVPVEQVLVGNGSDEILALVCRAFLEANDVAATPAVTYSLYHTLVATVHASLAEAPMLSKEGMPFSVDLEGLEKAKGELVFLANPNAQTGEWIEDDRLKKAVSKSEKFWIIDEAYRDFIDHGEPSALSALEGLDNFLVVRTFSKSHSLAGMRVGYALSPKAEWIAAMAGLKDSYNIDALAVRAGAAAIADRAYWQDCIQQTRLQRDLLKKELSELGFSCLPSQANFILCRPPGVMEAEKLYLALKAERILVRYFGGALSEFIRISLGDEIENQALLMSIRKVLS